MSPIPVLQFTNSIVRAGAEDHILVLLRGLDRHFFRPYFVCPPQLAKQIAADIPKDVEIIPLDLQQPYWASRIVRLGRILRARRIQILHSHMFYSSLCASPVGWLSRVPVVIETSHVREAWRTGWKARFFVDRLAGRFVDRYIAVSKAVGLYLTEEKGLPKRKVTVIWNGSDLRRFHPDHAAPLGLKRRLRFGEADPVLVAAARLEPQKGHQVLLEALPAVIQEFPNVKLVCVGDGRLRADLEAQTRALGLDSSVRFVGYQSDMQNWLALAEFTVLPSYWEGLPLTAIESLAAGKTLVATAVDGTTEVVIDEQTGLIVPPGNAALLVEAIKRLLRSAELRRKLAEAGRQWVEQNFSQARQVRETEELYIRALESRRRESTFPVGAEFRNQHGH